ncbi:proteasome assembly chaperone 2-like [Nothobranchius furzeri]|uniref:proteasome assembly chaperone 2-like n=1 Tax=Nothobranchius furzeri TaxID=105023 RepID=UPI003904DF54
MQMSGRVCSCLAEDLPLAVLLLFCSEGGQHPSHLRFGQPPLVPSAGHSSKCQQSHGPECKWKIPTSWNLPFGTGIPPALL